MDQQIHELSSSIKSSLQDLNGKIDGKFETLQRQVDAIDARGAQHHGTFSNKSLVERLKEDDAVARVVRDKRGRCVLTFEGDTLPLLERKTTITSPIVGAQTTGVLQIERIPGITLEPRPVLQLRDLLTATPTTYQVIDFVRVTSPLAIASPVPEASTKPENAVTFASASERIKTIATWIPATRQILDDFTELAAFLQNSLAFYVDMAEEQQLLLGDGTGENLHGIVPQASAFNTSLLNNTTGWTRIDVIGRAVEQIAMANELAASFVVMNPRDWWSLRLTKDNYGRYILGDPQDSAATPNLFGLGVVSTTNMAPGQFLVGSGRPEASEIRDRMAVQVEISTEHQDFFVRNLVAIRGEKRLALIVKRPGSYVTGTLNSSPIS